MSNRTCSRHSKRPNPGSSTYHDSRKEHFAFCHRGRRALIGATGVAMVVTFLTWGLGLLPRNYSPCNKITEVLFGHGLTPEENFFGWLATNIVIVTTSSVLAEVAHAWAQHERRYNAAHRRVMRCFTHFMTGPVIYLMRETAGEGGLTVELSNHGRVGASLTIRRSADGVKCALHATCTKSMSGQPFVGGRGNLECFTSDDMEQVIRLINQIVNRRHAPTA